MMLLGIESATESIGVAISDGEGSTAVVRVAGRRRHAENLAPAIAQVLERLGVGLDRLDAIALDVGPGLFTGLRVGVATAKGLAQGLGIGVVGVTSLEILALAAFDGGWAGTVVPVVDARRAEVFVAQYGRGAGDGDLVELVAPSRHRPELVSDAVVRGEGAVLACGDGALRYREQFEAGRLTVAGATFGSPDPLALIRLATVRLDAGTAPLEAKDVTACYLREASAQINWVRRDPVQTGA
jgi:tRNA threonylcarbamoyladenosine biosynthesis protein TsaB